MTKTDAVADIVSISREERLGAPACAVSPTFPGCACAAEDDRAPQEPWRRRATQVASTCHPYNGFQRFSPVDRSSSPRVVCIGEALFDCLADQVGAPREKVESWTPYPGGAPLNVATACTQLGVPAALVTCIGEGSIDL